MIEQIRKRAFKAHPQPLRGVEHLGEPSGDRRWARTFEDSHTAISVGLGCRPYEIFRNRSGLPDGHFAMLMLAVGRFVPLGP